MLHNMGAILENKPNLHLSYSYLAPSSPTKLNINIVWIFLNQTFHFVFTKLDTFPLLYGQNSLKQKAQGICVRTQYVITGLFHKT
jgi:hypothetical protein